MYLNEHIVIKNKCFKACKFFSLKSKQNIILEVSKTKLAVLQIHSIEVNKNQRKSVTQPRAFRNIYINLCKGWVQYLRTQKMLKPVRRNLFEDIT